MLFNDPILSTQKNDKKKLSRAVNHNEQLVMVETFDFLRVLTVSGIKFATSL